MLPKAKRKFEIWNLRCLKITSRWYDGTKVYYKHTYKSKSLIWHSKVKTDMRKCRNYYSDIKYFQWVGTFIINVEHQTQKFKKQIVKLNIQYIRSQNGEAYFKNLATFAVRFLKFVRLFWDVKY